MGSNLIFFPSPPIQPPPEPPPPPTEKKKLTYTLLGEHGIGEYWLGSDGQVYERTPALREVVIARPGWKLICADYSQFEVKIMAFLSQDQALIKAINTLDKNGKPTDVHNMMTCMLYGYDYEEFSKARSDPSHPRCKEFNELRSGVKFLTFGIPYGKTVPSIALAIRRPDETKEQALERAEKLYQDYMGQFPRLVAYLEEQALRAQTEGVTRSGLGRIRFYELDELMISSKYDLLAIGREAKNHGIQSTNADVIKMACVLIYRELWKEGSTAPYGDIHFQFVLHDELVLTCPDEMADYAAKLLKWAMEKAYNDLRVAFPNPENPAAPNVIPFSVVKNSVDVVVADHWEKSVA